LVTGSPKSSAGTTTMTLPPPMAMLLADHIAAISQPQHPDALVFTNSEGRPIHYDNWRRREWMPATAAACSDGAGFHDLRRLVATTMVVDGIDIKTAQVRFGHSDPRMTLAVCAAAPAEADHTAADRLEQQFFPDGGRGSTRAKKPNFSARTGPRTRASGAETLADLHLDGRAARI